MKYQQYLDYVSIRKAIDAYNSAYSPAEIHLETPEGIIKLPATYTDDAKVLMNSEQLRKEYPTFTGVAIVSEALITPLLGVNSILNLPPDVFKDRVDYMKEHLDLDLFVSNLTLTEEQFNYLSSGTIPDLATSLN